MAEHAHEWEIDYSVPVLDCLPPCYTYRCRVCGVQMSVAGEPEQIVTPRTDPPPSSGQ